MVQDLGLLPLIECSYETVDKGFLSAFAERWHCETNIFHLTIGEMTITLDDVSSLLHIPIVDGFYSYPHTSKDVGGYCIVDGAFGSGQGGHIFGD